MRLKKTYSSREVAALTGLTARQLQSWDERRLFASAVPPRRTAAGGFTERRYTPIDLLELLALAELQRRGFSIAQIRRLLKTLRERFGIRLYEAIGGVGRLTLFTDGGEIYGRSDQDEFFNLLRAPDQPLLALGSAGGLKELSGHVRRRRRRRTKNEGVAR